MSTPTHPLDAPARLLSEHSVTSLDVVHHADWRVLLAALPAQSVDLCLTDTPYGTTACAWDTVIDLAHWWREMRRVMKPRGAVVMTASQPYTSALVMSNPAWFRYEWIWEKNKPVGHLNATRQPMNKHESVIVFSLGRNFYNPQGVRATRNIVQRTNNGAYGACSKTTMQMFTGYPHSLLRFAHDNSVGHPTQKPVALFEYLIRTYTHEGDVVLDPFVGSGTTAVAARNTKRRYICGDISAEYVAIARERVRVEPFAPIVADDDVSDLPLFAAQEVA